MTLKILNTLLRTNIDHLKYNHLNKTNCVGFSFSWSHFRYLCDLRLSLLQRHPISDSSRILKYYIKKCDIKNVIIKFLLHDSDDFMSSDSSSTKSSMKVIRMITVRDNNYILWRFLACTQFLRSRLYGSSSSYRKRLTINDRNRYLSLDSIDMMTCQISSKSWTIMKIITSTDPFTYIACRTEHLRQNQIPRLKSF